MFAKSLALTGLATVASAHMLMSNPVPYGKSSLDNSPLLEDGSNFPCKMRDGAYDAQGASNVYEQGSTQSLSFTGQAVHGGGSCQISITTDAKPDKNSVWKVIKSIEGGCPAKGQEGNMGDNANADDPYTYDYTIPAELAAGDYTIAWTWFNKVGNREMYMNCAPLTVTGDGGSADHLDTLPDMFVANIGNSCGTKPSTDLKFPNPGKDVDRFNGATDAFAEPTGTCQAASGDGGDDGDSGDSPVATTTAASEPTQAQPSEVASTTNSIPGGVFITVSQPATTDAPAATQPAEEPAVTTEAPATTATPTPDEGSDDGSDNDSGDDAGNDTGSGSEGYAAGTACTSEGEWNCIGGTSFQRCASGTWSGTQTLSDGITCTPGQSTDIGLAAVKRGKSVMRRRVLRFRS